MKKGFNDELVDELYRDFCEAEGGVNHPVFDAWCECQEKFGEITTDSPINKLFYETIRYVIDTLEIKEEG